MPIESVYRLKTDRKDEIHLTKVNSPGHPRTILVTVVDADESRVPTIELQLDQLREICDWALNEVGDDELEAA